MALSDLVVRQAKTTGKAYTLPDIDGLSLAVTPTGNKSWHFRYYWLGKQKRMSLGNYPEVSLRDARTLRDEARALVAKDINPHVHRKQKRAAVKLAGENTFEAIYKKWLAHRELSLKKGRQTTLSILPRVFAKDVLPALGKRSIYDIKRPDLLEVIAKIEKRKAPRSCRRSRRAWCRSSGTAGGRRGLAHAALGRNDRDHLHGLLLVEWNEGRSRVSRAR
jgi:hypothetical protein